MEENLTDYVTLTYTWSLERFWKFFVVLFNFLKTIRPFVNCKKLFWSFFVVGEMSVFLKVLGNEKESFNLYLPLGKWEKKQEYHMFRIFLAQLYVNFLVVAQRSVLVGFCGVKVAFLSTWVYLNWSCDDSLELKILKPHSLCFILKSFFNAISNVGQAYEKFKKFLSLKIFRKSFICVVFCYILLSEYFSWKFHHNSDKWSEIVFIIKVMNQDVYRKNCSETQIDIINFP